MDGILPPRRPVERERQRADRSHREQPPRRDANALEGRGRPERGGGDDGDQRVVADDEVVEEAPERAKAFHRASGAGSGAMGAAVTWRRRRAATMPAEATSTSAIRARIAASPPGHSAPDRKSTRLNS